MENASTMSEEERGAAVLDALNCEQKTCGARRCSWQLRDAGGDVSDLALAADLLNALALFCAMTLARMRP